MDPDLAARILHRVGFAIRLLLLLPLLWGALITCAAYRPTPRTLDQFRSALVAGDVDRVDYRTYRNDRSGALADLVWSESPLIWHEVNDTTTDSQELYTVARLKGDLRRAFVQPSMVQEPERKQGYVNGIFPDWPFRLPGGANLWWIAAIWVIAFVGMLCYPPRLANRWAWFWMFTIGQIGVFLFLILEPRPLWRGPGEGLTRVKRVDGGSGCWYSILLGFAAVAMAVGVGELVERVLS
jgi:hypothetical protein